MVKTYVAIAFISLVGVLAIVVGTRPTVASGHVMAADLMDQLERQDDRLERVDCDEEIPITESGAVFQCSLYSADEQLDVEYTMGRDGSMYATPLVAPRNHGHP